MTVVIVANGDLRAAAWLRPHLAAARLIIAADGGADHLHRLGVLPHHVFGDLDSASPDVQAWLAAAGVEVMLVSAEKDETDLELALLYAVAHYDDPVLVAAALGGRFDQTFANVSLLAHPALAGRDITLATAHERVRLLGPGRHAVTGRVGDLLSLLPFGGDVTVTASDGLQWPLHDSVLQFGPARGVSNRFTQPVAHVTIAAGRLLMVHTSRDWQR